MTNALAVMCPTRQERHAVFVGVEKIQVFPGERSLIRILVREGRQRRSCVGLQCHWVGPSPDSFAAGFAAGSLKPLDRVGDSAGTLGEAERIVEVVGVGNKSGCAQGVARLGSSLATDGGEDGVRFAQGPWPEFHSHRRKGSLGRSPAARRRRIASVALRWREPVGLRHHFVHTSFDARQQGFESGDSGLLFGVSSGGQTRPAPLAASGLEMSTPPIASDKRSESTRMYCAYCSTAPSTRAASHGTCTNSR